MELERENRHWEDGFAYPYEKQRSIFPELERSAKSGLITAVYGLRRVGKSTLLRQLINSQLAKGVKRESIFLYSFDEQVDDFWQIIAEYEKVSQKPIGKGSSIYLDEIQNVPDWQAKVKKLYDTSKARIVLSGSNSALLRKSGEGLAGRINEFFLPELSFSEFLDFQSKKVSPLASSGRERLYLEYIRKPFPETALNDTIDAKAYADTIARKVIFEDLPQVFPIDEPALLYRLFSIICANPGMVLDYSSLASDLGRDRKTLSAYSDFLVYGFLVARLYNYSTNRLSSEKKLKKVYPSLACFAKSETSKIIENAVAQALKPRFFWNYKNRAEVDFIVDEPFFAFEVKYKVTPSADDFRGIKQFRQAYPKAKAVLVAKSEGNGAIAYYNLDSYLKKNKIMPGGGFGPL
ncbi:MAG: ATP-binding protein [Candidatus Micrarchaeia archaeon]|jgi:hypothetical protein